MQRRDNPSLEQNGDGLLSRQEAEDSAVKESVIGMMERQVGNMERLVEDLLDVSRITRGKVTLKKQMVELAAVVKYAILSVRPMIDARDHQITMSVPRGIQVAADPTRLEQILTNLLNNSAKYAEKSGQIRITADQKDDWIMIRVRDNGIGISADLPGYRPAGNERP